MQSDCDDLDASDEHDIHIAELTDDGESIPLGADSLWDMSL